MIKLEQTKRKEKCKHGYGKTTQKKQTQQKCCQCSFVISAKKLVESCFDTTSRAHKIQWNLSSIFELSFSLHNFVMTS